MKNATICGDSGYTLVEMMIVDAILGILAAVAIPAYNGYVATGKEAEAKSGLSNIALLEEQFFAQNRTYSNAVAAIGFVPDTDTSYAWSIVAAATTFTATADGSANGLPIFTVDETNAKTRDGAAGW